MRSPWLLAPALLCLAVAGCDDLSTSTVCPSEPGPALLVNVVDAASGLPVAQEARGQWTTGALADSLRHVSMGPDSAVVLAAFGPPGTYEVRVERPGHADWVRSGVVVAPGACGPARADVTAQLTAGH